MASVTVVTPPAEEPVTLARVRAERAVTHTEDDTILEAKITEVRQHVEEMLGKALVTQTWRLHLHEFPAGEIALPGGRVQSVESVTYIDEAGDTQTLATSAYQVDTYSRRPILRRVPGTEWPKTQDTLNAVTVELVVGYGAAADVPGGIVAAILLLIGDLAENREAQIVGSIIQENKAVQRLLFPHRNLEV